MPAVIIKREFDRPLQRAQWEGHSQKKVDFTRVVQHMSLVNQAEQQAPRHRNQS